MSYITTEQHLFCWHQQTDVQTEQWINDGNKKKTPVSVHLRQEAQLPQRNSASATHTEGGLGPPAHSLDAPSGYIYMRLVEFETHNKRTAVH